MTRSSTNAVEALCAELDAGAEAAEALFRISREHNISEGYLRYLYDYAARMDTTERRA